MELLGQQLINASRQKVWNALNDPDVLIRCIPGCEEISRVSDNQLQVRMMVKMGPVRSRFAGMLSLEDINAPESWGCTGCPISLFGGLRDRIRVPERRRCPFARGGRRR